MEHEISKQIDETNLTLLDVAASVIAIQRILNRFGITRPQVFQDELPQVRLLISDCPEANRLKAARHLLVLDEEIHGNP